MLMRYLQIFAAIFLLGCRGDAPAIPKPAASGEVKPFIIKSNDGIDHEFYKNVGLDEFLKQLPTGSVDSVNLELDGGPKVFALVKVSELVGRDLTTIRFTTTFQLQDGQTIEREWTAAQDRKSGSTAALFCLPPTVVGGETRISQSSEIAQPK